MSAPAPRSGSSGRCAKSGSSPVTRRSASTGSVPGRDPTPEAGPHRVAPGPTAPSRGSSRACEGGGGPGPSSVGESTATTVARRRQDAAGRQHGPTGSPPAAPGPPDGPATTRRPRSRRVGGGPGDRHVRGRVGAGAVDGGTGLRVDVDDRPGEARRRGPTRNGTSRSVLTCKHHGALAEHAVTPLGVRGVEDRGLPRRNAALPRRERDPQPAVLGRGHLTRHRSAVRP
jgi:hypothetical protein